MPRTVNVSAELLDPAHPLHPASMGEPACRAFAWIDLMGRARPTDGQSLRRGELRASVRFLSSRWNWSPKKVARFLADLERDGRIAWDKPAPGKRESSVLTVCNYDTYNPHAHHEGNASNPVHQRAQETRRKRESDEPVTTSPVGGAGEETRVTTRTTLHHKVGKRESDAPATTSPLGCHAKVHKGVTTLSVTGTQEETIVPSLVPVTSFVGEKIETAEQISFVEPVERVYTPNEIAHMMVGRWAYECPARPPESQIKKQFRIAVLVAAENQPHEIVRAWEGMAHTYPYNRGEVWDMFDFRRSFGKAYQNASTELNEDVRWQAFFDKEE